MELLKQDASKSKRQIRILNLKRTKKEFIRWYVDFALWNVRKLWSAHLLPLEPEIHRMIRYIY